MTTDPILVVDDDDALRQSLVAALETLPVEITEAATGRRPSTCWNSVASRSWSPTW